MVGVHSFRRVRLYWFFQRFFPSRPCRRPVIAADPSLPDNIVPVFGMAWTIIFRAPRREYRDVHTLYRMIRIYILCIDNKNAKQMAVMEGPLLPFAVKIE